MVGIEKLNHRRAPEFIADFPVVFPGAIEKTDEKLPGLVHAPPRHRLVGANLRVGADCDDRQAKVIRVAGRIQTQRGWIECAVLGRESFLELIPAASYLDERPG